MEPGLDPKYYINKTKFALQSMSPSLQYTDAIEEEALIVTSDSLYNYWKSVRKLFFQSIIYLPYFSVYVYPIIFTLNCPILGIFSVYINPLDKEDKIEYVDD